MSVSKLYPAGSLGSTGGQYCAPTLNFGLTAWEAEALKDAARNGHAAVTGIAHEKAAKNIAKVFDGGALGKLFSRDVRIGGLSLEEMSSRFLTLFGIYIPQGILAVKDQKHPYETNGRNILIWVMTFLLTQFLKNDTFGVNSLFLSPLMIEKGKLQAFDRKADIPANAGFFKRAYGSVFKAPFNVFQRTLNRHFGMKGDYLAVLKDAGIEISESDIKKALKSTKAPWASLDNNKLDLINNRYEELRKIASADGVEALAKLEKPVSQALYETYPKVLRRLNIFPLISTSLVTAATVYVIGGLAMKLVYKFIAPFDKDFNPAAVSGGKKKEPLNKASDSFKPSAGGPPGAAGVLPASAPTFSTTGMPLPPASAMAAASPATQLPKPSIALPGGQA
jgi:hypothetical protein